MQERPFTYHQRADFSPADCIVSGRRENLIDIGAPDIPGYGRVYIDIITFAELATAMGYIDGEQASQASLMAQARIDTLKMDLADTIGKNLIQVSDLEEQIHTLESAPNREALKEFHDGITDLVDGLTDRLFRPGDGVPDLPVPTDEPSAIVSDIGAVGSGKRAVPRRGKQKPKPAASEPEVVVGSGSADVVGDSESAPASAASGGPELHESFERDEPADGDAEPDLEGFFDTPGDEGSDRLPNGDGS